MNLFVAHAISAAPVVDDMNMAVGVISKTDLLHRHYEGEDGKLTTRPRSSLSPHDLEPGLNELARDSATVAEAMTPLVIGVPADASLPQAAAVMAFECIHHLIVHDARGNMVGLVSALDLLAWLARLGGYPVNGKQPA